ncbi:carnitine dehydratase [Mycobacterium sp. GA-1999]|nr:carnitine dehydratase [Mycobacterium sp. GA-0227b]KUH84463.1 carnitine dehydratase [Mycobacterium sp. GA-1999]KUH89401.1 carnitine dehydratase [Mycobacterium sp. IS-1556]
MRVIEVGGIGPGPFAAMLLSDMGADVVRVDRPADTAKPDAVLHRGRRMLEADLKDPADRDAVLHLIAEADVLIEGFRPGVAERLGLGPTDCCAVNPRLVYGRMTGYGQDGPLAQAAGHDINFIAVAGALGAIGADAPVPPLKLIGDMGGGGMLLAFGIACALAETRHSGQGQVIDAAIVDGTALQLSMIHDMLANGTWTDTRDSNTLDGAAPFYTVYRCSDGGYVAVGAIEKQFYANLLSHLDLASDPLFARQWDRSAWPAAKARLGQVFASKARDEWTALLNGADVCVSPVLSLREAVDYTPNTARAVYELDSRGAFQPAPAPRFSRTPAGRRWHPASTPSRVPSEVRT